MYRYMLVIIVLGPDKSNDCMSLTRATYMNIFPGHDLHRILGGPENSEKRH